MTSLSNFILVAFSSIYDIAMDFFVRGKHNGMTNLQLNKSDCVNQKMTETAAMSITFILNCQIYFEENPTYCSNISSGLLSRFFLLMNGNFAKIDFFF